MEKIIEKKGTVKRALIVEAIRMTERNIGWIRTLMNRALNKRDTYKKHGRTWYCHNATAGMYELDILLNNELITKLDKALKEIDNE